MLRKALKAATPTLRQLAEDAGVTYSAVRLYVRGKRTPDSNVLARLVKALRARSGRLAKLADELEAAARTTSTGRRKSP